MIKRKIFDELLEGVAAMKSHREGKITLRTYRVEADPSPPFAKPGDRVRDDRLKMGIV